VYEALESYVRARGALPAGISFEDKGGKVRMRCGFDGGKRIYDLSQGSDRAAADMAMIPDMPLPEEWRLIRIRVRRCCSALLVHRQAGGHFARFACLDYSVASAGRSCVSVDGETELSSDKLAWVS